MFNKKILFILLLFYTSVGYARVMDLKLASNYAHVAMSNYDEYSTAIQMKGGLLWDEDSKTHMLYYGMSTLTNFYAQENAKHSDHGFNLGIKFLLINFDYNNSSQTGLGLGIGGVYSKDLNLDFTYPVRVSSSFYYAPSVVMISDDISSVYELDVNIEMLLQENAIIYTGLSGIISNLEERGHHTVHSGLHLGIKILF